MFKEIRKVLVLDGAEEFGWGGQADANHLRAE